MNLPNQSHTNLTKGLTLRALGIGIVLMVLNAYWLNDAAWGGRTLHTYISLFVNTVFCLFVLVLLNLVLKRTFPRHALHNTELFVVYVMLVTVSTLGGNTNMGYLIYHLAHPFWFATAENDWLRLFGGHIPDWFAVRDRNVLRGFYEGESSFFTAQNLYGWLVPALAWSAFIFVLYFVLICMNVILRRQFTNRERLTYPIAQLPLEMGRTPGTLFSQPTDVDRVRHRRGDGASQRISFPVPRPPVCPCGATRVLRHISGKTVGRCRQRAFFGLAPQ